MEKVISGFIPGYADKYVLYEDGTIVSFCKKHPIIRRPHINTSGYLHVRLIANGKDHSVSIHVLLAKMFIHNPNNLPTVNHIDGDKLNNKLSNLEWCSHSDNQKHAYACNLRESKKGESNFKAKLTEDDVLDIHKSQGTYKEIAKKYLISEGTVYRIKKQISWTHVLR